MQKNQLLKILEISSYPPPRAGWGVRISFVRQHLEQLGHECQVLNIGSSRRIKSSDYLDVQGGRDFLVKVVTHARKGYLIHTHLNGDSPKGLLLALVAELASRVLGSGCVLTFHAGPEQRLFPKSRSWLLAPLFSLAFAMPKKIICNSSPVKEKIITYGVPFEKIVPIPAFSRQYLEYEAALLPKELEDFILKSRPALAAYFFLRPEFFVQSMLVAIKQLKVQLPELGIIIIGGDTKNEAANEMLENVGLQGCVYQAGDLSHDEFMTVLSKVHFYVRTPKKDGVCSSVLEALSQRVPVIASENGTRPNSVITFHSDNSDDLREKLWSAWEDYAVVKEGVVIPHVEDTVSQEASLLLENASCGKQ